MTACHVSLAVWAWRWLTAFAPWVSRSEKAVMSNWFASSSTPRPSSRTSVTGTPPASSSGPATRRTRSVSKRSLPAETGVWMVNTLSRRTSVQASASDRPLATYSRARSARRNAEWPSLRCQTAGARLERPDGAHATDAQDELLVEAHLAAADVQDVGDRPVGVRVLGDVRVEQEDRHAPDLGDPDGDEQVAPGQLDGDGQGQPGRVLDAAERQPRQVVVGVVVLLVAVGVDRLAEVALAIQQPDADRRQGHVAGRLHVVAGEDAETAGVDAERLVEAVLRAEVGDRPAQPVGVLALEPVVGAVGHVRVELGQDVVVFGQELRVVEQPRPVDRAADDRDRAPIARPGGRIDPIEQAARARMPRPVEVVGKAPQPFEPRRQQEARRRDRRDADWIHRAASYPLAGRRRHARASPTCRSGRRVRCGRCRCAWR